jgi:hypothetical protein
MNDILSATAIQTINICRSDIIIAINNPTYHIYLLLIYGYHTNLHVKHVFHHQLIDASW